MDDRRSWKAQVVIGVFVAMIVLFWLGVAALHVAGGFGFRSYPGLK